MNRIPLAILILSLPLASCSRRKADNTNQAASIPLNPIDDVVYTLDSCHYRKVYVGAHTFQYIHSSKCPHCKELDLYP